MAAPFIQTSFSKGEIAPSLWGHVDLQAWHTACTTLRNMFVGFRGGAYSRAGTRFSAVSVQRPNLGELPPRLINWDFNVNQDYVLEFGDEYVRFVFQGGQVTEGPIAISNIGLGIPTTIFTVAGHGYAVGDWVTLAGINPPLGPYLNGNTFIVSSVPTPTSFTLADIEHDPYASFGFPGYTGGGTGARIYTIASPYAAIDLPYLKFAQSADVMTLTCVNPPRGTEYPPYDLKRLGPVNWTLTPTQFGTTTPAPSIATAAATTHPNSSFSPPTLPAAYAYEITKINTNTRQESAPSPIANVVDGVDMAETAGSNILFWSQVPGPGYYNIYRAPTSYNTDPASPTVALPVPAGALFGFIGSSYGNSFVDSNIVPNFSISPPQDTRPFDRGQILGITVSGSSADWTFANAVVSTSSGSGLVARAVITGNSIVSWLIEDPGHDYQPSDTVTFTGDGTSATGSLVVGPQTGTYPGVVSYFQERRAYAQTLNAPDERWMSKPGQFNNFDVSNPVQDSDALSGTPWSEKVDGIQWMISMPLGLLSFSASGVWQDGPSGTFFGNPAAITPTNQLAAPQSSIGCSATVPPLRVNWDILYVEYMNSAVLDLAYQIYFNIYAGTDISWSSSHLLDFFAILQWQYARTPHRLIWAVRNDGVLLSITYVKEQEVVGWGRHTTQGMFRSVCHCSENPVDATYFVVERPVATGGTRYFIERMDNRAWQSIENCWCVDAGIGTAVNTPNAMLFADELAGTVTFTATSPVFAPGSVGQVIRMGGGIAVVSNFISPTQVQGSWTLPASLTLPDDPSGMIMPQPPGAWTIAPQITQLAGLFHLIGRQVVGLADGVPVGPFLVDSNGMVTLNFPASVVVLGLGFTSQLQTVYLDTGTPTIQARRRAVYNVTARVEGGSLPQIGANQPDGGTSIWPGMTTTVPANADPIVSTYQSPGGATVIPLFNADVRANVPAAWNKRGQLAVQQTLPLPLQITALMPEALPGDLPETEIRPRAQPAQQQQNALR